MPDAKDTEHVVEHTTEETVELKARIVKLETTVKQLNQDIARMKDEQIAVSEDIAASQEALERECQSVTEESKALKEYVHELETSNEELRTQLDGTRDELAEAAVVHDNNSEAIECLQQAIEEQNQIHGEELYSLKNGVVNKSSSKGGLSPIPEDESVDSDGLLASLKDQVRVLEEESITLTNQLDEAVSSDQHEGLLEEIEMLHHEIRTLSESKNELSAQLAESEAKANNKAVKVHKDHLTSLSDKDASHQNELDTIRLQVVELKESNERMNHQLSELSTQSSPQGESDHTVCIEQLSSVQADLQNALSEGKERKVQHNLKLASVQADFHNASIQLDELAMENQKLKDAIEALAASKETEEDRNFEELMNKAHARFESMEKALHDRVARLEKEKDKVTAEFNAELIKQEEEHTQTKIELSAWKLEMQNALNDIEALKKERDELSDQLGG